ncbi:hypothetical protein OAC90_01225 [Planktomarina sp.]|nr:hypothetical protein [Planktomarina sp.]
MNEQEQQKAYSQRIARVLGQERLALPSQRQLSFLDRAFDSLLDEEGSLEKISDLQILGEFERIMLHSSPIVLEVGDDVLARLSQEQDPGPQDLVASEPDRPRNVTIPEPPLSMDLDKKK